MPHLPNQRLKEGEPQAAGAPAAEGLYGGALIRQIQTNIRLMYLTGIGFCYVILS